MRRTRSTIFSASAIGMRGERERSEPVFYRLTPPRYYAIFLIATSRNKEYSCITTPNICRICATRGIG